MPQPPRPVPYVAAHRGARRVAPENTMAAFTAALDRGAVALELDVHRTSDGRAVVIHDDLVDRTTDGSGPVSAMEAADIKRLDAGSWWSPQCAGETVPFLEEVIELTERRAVLHVELKGPGASLLAGDVVATVRRWGAEDRVVVMSFDLNAALAARQADREITVLPIVSGKLRDQLGFVLGAGLSGLNQSVDRWGEETIQRFHEHGLLVHGSLVNDRARLEAFFSRGGDVADSDSPDCFGPDCSGPGGRLR
jgi:glycerophosphoryl diester phosphodiesterase